MKTKNKYVTPQIEVIDLDIEISLIMMSSPPEGPEEFAINSDPFRNPDNC
jgi:hypothetical protein